MKVEANERHREGAEVPDPRSLADRVRRFVQTEAGFAQVYTINRDGYPVGRTMVAVLNDDWSVDLVQRRQHRRIGQIRRNPRMEVVWVGPPAAGSVNDRPHVYDVGLAIPQVVFLRGRGVFMNEEELLETYTRQTAIQRGRGLTRAPLRSADNVRTELVGIRVRPEQVRAEGFGVGAASFTWDVADGSAA